VETRKEIWRSLKTDSPGVAAQKAEAVWNELIEGWEARLAGRSDEAEERFAAAQDLAAARGVRFLSARAVAELPIGQVLERVEAVAPAAAPDQPDRVEAAALLGGAAEVPITVSRALELYWGMTRDELLNKSKDQVRRWKNPRKKAIRNFISVVGDKPISQITADDMSDFRNWWMERIELEGLTTNSGNKDLTHLGSVLKTVNARKRLGIALPVSGFHFKESDSTPRPPFSDAWIRERLLAPGALGGLNAEARAILLVTVNTGCRPGEAAGLLPEDIVLDAEVPHIRIRDNAARAIKNAPSRRNLPLVGVSLEAFKDFPNGFPRYQTDSADLSATVNKYLRENGLAETERHTLYSLRHSFEDRLLRARVDERVRRDILGHALGRERYGEGGGPAFLLGEIQRAAL
jgi:integrase